jgi:hypothetical protein
MTTKAARLTGFCKTSEDDLTIEGKEARAS